MIACHQAWHDCLLASLWSRAAWAASANNTSPPKENRSRLGPFQRTLNAGPRVNAVQPYRSFVETVDLNIGPAIRPHPRKSRYIHNRIGITQEIGLAPQMPVQGLEKTTAPRDRAVEGIVVTK